MKNLFAYLLIYNTVIITLIIITIRNHLKLNRLSLIILFLIYLITVILFMLDIFQYFNINTINQDVINYIEEIDHSIRITEIERDISEDENIYTKFIQLFTNNNSNYYLGPEYRNISYIKNNYIDKTFIKNTLDIQFINDKYRSTIIHNNEVLLFIESFVDVLNDLESIQDNLAKGNIKIPN